MKKLLLMAAAALMSFPAFAETGYVPGEVVASSGELTSGKYFIVAASKTREGFIKMRANDEHPFFKENVQDLSGGTLDLSYVFDITVTAGEGENPATFTIKNLSDSRYLSYHGNQADGKGHVAAYLESNENAKIANLALDTQEYEPATGMNFSKYFAVYQTNVTHTYPNDSEASIPYFHVNGDGFGSEHLAWWKKGDFNFTTSGSMTLLAFVKANETELISTTVNFKFEADGETYATATVTGAQGGKVQVACPDFCVADGSATASVVIDGNACDVIVTPVIPFAYTETADEPKKWQLVGQHTNQISTGHMWKYTADDAVVPTENVAQSTATSINANFTDAHLFAFVGNLKDGFKIYNKAAGEDKTLYYTSEGGKIGTAGENPDVWKLKVCSSASNTSLYCCFSADNFSNYLNWQGDAVKSYGSNDAGSGCYFYTPAAAGIKYYEAKIGNSFKLNTLNVSGCTELYNAAVENPYDLDAAKALNAALLAAPTNGPLPTEGHFYRFNGCFNSYNNYLTVDADDNLTIVSGKAANGPETVFYYDGTYLVSLANGKVVGKSTGNSGDKKVFLTNNANAASIEFKTPSDDNTKCYIITISDKPEDHKNYYIAGNNAGTISHGSLETTSEAPAAFYWTVEDVQWLPVYFGDNSTTTLFLPVGIDGNKMEGRLEARDLTVNSVKTEELVKSESPAESIEPGHGYIVKKLGSDNGSGWNASTKCIFVEVNYNKTVASQASNDLTGTIYAAEATEKHFVYNPNEDADPAFNPASDFVPGFQAHFVAPDNHNYSQYTVKDYENRTTSSISEIVADRENGSENGAKVVYDLQGRRVANASKGIFIINGVKTLVK